MSSSDRSLSPTTEPARIEHDLYRVARADPHREAVVQSKRRLSYAALARASARAAQDLVDGGLSPGDRVGVLYDKDVRAVVALYAAWTAGGVPVPIHAGLKPAQVEHILMHSEASALLCDPRIERRLPDEALSGLEPVDVAVDIVIETDEGEDDPLEAVASIAREGGDAPAVLLYTSGSTGLPKGILISHANLVAGARIVSKYLELRSDERIISLTPFSFDYGLNQLLCATRTGSCLVLQRSMLPADVCRTLESENVTGLAAVPPMFIQLMGRASPLETLALPHLRYITNTGGVFPPDLVKKYRACFPDVRLYLMYGLTEAFRSTYLPPSETDARPDSIGKAIPETEILVLDENGDACAPDVPGELVHRGPTVALEYWRDPDATAKRFRHDPEDPSAPHRVVYSGDLVRRDKDGYLYFVSRRDAMIKSQGFRISPEEVEVILLRSDLVKEAVAAGEPDEVAGAKVVAHVVPADDDTFALDAMLAHCRAHMPSYMVPGRVQVHASFPRTSTGKIDRKQVVAVPAEGGPA